jgi:hypothetical protein
MLTRKQRIWLEEYLACWNATEAARRAGYATPRQAGAKLVSKAVIQDALRARVAEKTMAADEVLVRLAEHARGDMGNFFKIVEIETDSPLPTQEVIGSRMALNDDGEPCGTLYRVRQVTIDIDKMLDQRLSRLIKKFSDSPKNGLSIELYDAQSALDKLGKHLKIFTEESSGSSVRREYVGVDVNAV